MHHPTDRITHTTAFVTPVVDHCWVWVGRRLGEWVHSLKDRSDDPSRHERPLSPRSYISLRETIYRVRQRQHNETVKDAALTNELVLRFERRTCQIIRNKVTPPPPPPPRRLVYNSMKVSKNNSKAECIFV